MQIAVFKPLKTAVRIQNAVSGGESPGYSRVRRGRQEVAVSVNYVTRPWESGLFRRCRRAWNFGARERQNYEPIAPSRVFDFSEAIHDALDVYYFPGMWDWNRAIVCPLAVAGLEKSMRRQRDAYAHTRDLSAEQVQDWEQHLELGIGLLQRYFEWAREVDRFTPIGVASQFDVTLPDPGDAGPR